MTDIDNYKKKVKAGKPKPRNAEVRRPDRPATKNGYNQQVVEAYFVEMGLPAPMFEYRFHPVRKWRWDLCWDLFKVAVEVQGGVWTAGRHTRGAALLKEWEKLNTAAGMGWRVIFVQPADLCTTQTIEYVKEALRLCVA